MKCSETEGKVIEDNNENQSSSQNVTTTKEDPPKKEEKKQNIVSLAVKLSNYEKGVKLGEGSFGKVFILTDKESKQEYCAKISKKVIEDNSLEELLSLLTEVSLFSKFDHPAIVKFVGYSTIDFNNDPKPVIIMEYTPNGTLRQALLLESYCRSLPEWDDTHKLINIYGIASAMAYLHLHNILHRDLKTENILLDSYLFPKVADFGLSTIESVSTEKMIFDNSDVTCGTPLYMSPEILSERKYSKAGDVYAFSLIVYEILTNKKPFEEIHSFIEIIKKVVFDGERPRIDDEYIPQSYKDLITKCWQSDPSKRPTFEEIVDMLENDEGFITSSVDKEDYLNYVDYVKTYQSKFDSSKPQIPVRFKFANSKGSRLTNDLKKSGIKNENKLYAIIGRGGFGFSMTGGFKKKRKTFNDYKKSADEGDLDSIIKYGEILYKGNNEVEADKKLAAFYIKKAADNGYDDSILQYAEMCYKGDGIHVNFDEALHYFKISAEKNNRKGTYKLVKMLLDKRQSAFNPAEGLKWLEKAAVSGSCKAAMEFANILYNGQFDVPVDKVKASKFYEIAAKQSNVIAQCNLGLMLMNGDGIPMNKEKALVYFRDAANKNNLTAINNYLKLLREGVNEIKK